ncbi:uncharacterized protein [Branchiostoma lanceolatum]|uniref:uncharacterized protein n=1 Tax=Branchiostoma lanceolatum TaxID=7740 RepID=UPI001132A8FC
MPILSNSCCGCCDLRTGSVVVGALCLNNAVFAFLYGLATTGLSTPGGWTAWVTLILEILFLIACILLLIGIKKGNVTFMKIWLLFAIILVVWELIQIIVRSVQIVGDKGFGAALAQVLGVQWVLVLIFIGVKIYGILVVYSYTQTATVVA